MRAMSEVLPARARAAAARADRPVAARVGATVGVAQFYRVSYRDDGQRARRSCSEAGCTRFNFAGPRTPRSLGRTLHEPHSNKHSNLILRLLRLLDQ